MKAEVAGPARRDILAILASSGTRFGQQARHRYRLLLERAISDIAADSERPGVRTVEGASEGVRVYHLRHVRTLRLPIETRVGAPRHYLVFRVQAGRVLILRVLHDAMDLPSWIEDA